MNVRTVLRTTSLALAAAAVLLLAGCSALGLTPEQRVEAFIDAVNAGTGYQTHLDPNATSYSTSSTSSFWNQYFPAAERNFTVSSTSVSGNTVTATITNSAGQSDTYTFTMVEDSSEAGLLGGTNYLISRVSTGGSTIFQ